MKRIFKNLIPYWKTIILIVLLLVVQAYCDLSLPQYTSDIIDVGIQNGGVEHITPEKITSKEFREAQIFMNDDEKDLWQSAYTEEGDLYHLNVTDEKELDDLDDKLLTSIVLTYQLGHMSEADFKDTVKETMEKNPQTAPMAAQIDDMSISDIEKLMHTEIDSFQAEDEEGHMATYVDMRPLMEKMIASGQIDASMQKESRKSMEDMISTTGAETLHSMGVAYAVSCNEAAGLDVDDMQMSYLWSEGLKMFMMALLMLAAAILVSFLAARVGAGVGRDVRGKVFRNVVGFSNAEMDKFSTASLITRSTNDVQQIQMVTAMMLRIVLYAPIIGLGGVYKVAQTGARMEWILSLIHI